MRPRVTGWPSGRPSRPRGGGVPPLRPRRSGVSDPFPHKGVFAPFPSRGCLPPYDLEGVAPLRHRVAGWPSGRRQPLPWQGGEDPLRPRRGGVSDPLRPRVEVSCQLNWGLAPQCCGLSTGIGSSLSVIEGLPPFHIEGRGFPFTT